MNKKVTFYSLETLRDENIFTMNKFHTKISNGEFFPNYGIWLLAVEEQLDLDNKPGNLHNDFVVAIIKDYQIVSRILWNCY